MPPRSRRPSSWPSGNAYLLSRSDGTGYDGPASGIPASALSHLAHLCGALALDARSRRSGALPRAE